MLDSLQQEFFRYDVFVVWEEIFKRRWNEIKEPKSNFLMGLLANQLKMFEFQNLKYHIKKQSDALISVQNCTSFGEWFQKIIKSA